MATGDGPMAAAAGLEALLAAVRPRRLLVAGVAGGLTPGLAEGALVAAARVVDAAGRAVPRAPDAPWLEAALAAGALAGTAVSADRILAGPAERQAVLRAVAARAAVEHAENGAPGDGGAAAGTAGAADDAAGAAGSPGPAVATVDLESAAYARVAAAWSLPYLVVRAVLDPADEELPLDFESCRDGSGRVSNARVVGHALLRPWRLVALWRLRARVRQAAARLGEIAPRLVAAAPASGALAGANDVAAAIGMREAIAQADDEPVAVAGRRTA